MLAKVLKHHGPRLVAHGAVVLKDKLNNEFITVARVLLDLIRTHCSLLEGKGVARGNKRSVKGDTADQSV